MNHFIILDNDIGQSPFDNTFITLIIKDARGACYVSGMNLWSTSLHEPLNKLF